MESVYKELEESKAEIEKLKEEYLKLHEKESIIKDLSLSNEKLRAVCDEKTREWEGENRGLVLALEKANERVRDKQLQICAFKEEIEGLKVLLSVTQNKCLEAVEKDAASIELRQRDYMVQTLEEENRKVGHELKWKKEQFSHLEEAHSKLQSQLKASKTEWEIEKSNLLDEIGSLQTNLDSHTRISEDLKSRLERCNQALMHEESRRKTAEIQLSESKTCCENAYAECEEAKSKIEYLTHQRENEIALLRSSLGSKDGIYKEMEYQSRKLEQENQELRFSLKEMQEAQIFHHAGSTSSFGKLKSKLKHLEQINRDYDANLKAKDAEWSSQINKMVIELHSKDVAMNEVKMELESLKLLHKDCSAIIESKEARLNRIIEDLKECKYQLEIKDGSIKELRVELERCHASIMELKVQSEETSLMLSVYKTGLLDAKSKLEDEKAKRDVIIKEKDEKGSLLIHQIEVKPDKELENVEFKEHALKLECEYRQRLTEACDALDNIISEAYEIEFEKYIWESTAEKLKIELEESHNTRKELEASLISQIEFEEMLQIEKDSLSQMLKEKARGMINLQNQIEELEELLLRLELETFIFAQIDEERKSDNEKGALLEANTILSSERETMLGYFDQLCGQMGEFTSDEDMQLMGKLAKIVQAFKTHELDDLKKDERLNYRKENHYLLPATKKCEVVFSTERSPFKELQLG